MNASRLLFSLLTVSAAFSSLVSAQSADWTEAIWREPQLRYLLPGQSWAVSCSA
jgi:hypothetical protein